MTRGKCWILALLILALRARGDAAEIKGTVTGSTEKYATIVSDSDLVPTPGDKVSIYFNLPGADEEISVAEGRVYEITGSNIMVEIANATGTVEKGQLARITSEHPLTRNSATPATVSSPAPLDVSQSVTQTPTIIPQLPPPTAKTSPVVTIKEEPKARAFVIPQLLRECEAGQRQICGTWTRRGNAFYAAWENGATATLTIERFDDGGIIITRHDTKDIGFRGRYTGKPVGKKIEGRVTWSWQGKSWSGFWSATW